MFYGRVSIYILFVHSLRPPYLMARLLGPLQIFLALFLLYRHMQMAIVPGVGLLLLLIPLNLYVQRIQKKLTVSE